MKPVKIPLIMQMEALECGAASLSMILAHYGRWITLEEARVECGVSRDGVSAKSIYKAAKSYGLDVKAVRCDADAAREFTSPAIIHWNFNHFVVLCGFTNRKAVINDPAQGHISVSLEEFDQAFTGVALLMTPGENFKKGGAKSSVWVYAKKRLSGTLTAVVLVLIINVLIAITEIVQPVFSKVFLDSILSNHHPEWITPFLALMAAVLAFTMIITYIHTISMRKIQGKFAIASNSEFMWHVLRLPISFFSQRYAGDIATRQQANEEITNSLFSTLAPIAISFFMVFLYLAMMLTYSPMLTIVGISTIILNMLVAQYIVRKTINFTRVTIREEGKLASTTTSGIEMIETIKASGAEAGFFERWSGYLASESYEGNRIVKTTVVFDQIPIFLSKLANMAVLLLGSFLIIRGQFTAGMLLAFQGLLTSFIGPAMDVVDATSTIQSVRASMERVEDVMQYDPDVEYGDSDEPMTQARKLSGDIVLTDITFGYNKMRPPLISNFSMHIKPGSKVAFVGGSGCGKSTLTRLISGLYAPWTGTIEFDGKPISQINHLIFTSSVAVVDQDIVLFEDTVNSNIKMWDESIQNFEVILAAHDAQIHEEIMLRDGYNTKLLEGGKNFSGGQRQRLEIARALAQDPTIVIMDEATSALDAKTEYEVIHGIAERGITCIVVAHRLSTIRDCDEIIVMDEGNVVERGTHEELMALQGYYCELITTE